jgi:hypothetical protein
MKIIISFACKVASWGAISPSWRTHHSSLRASCASFNPPFICKSVLLLVPSLLATKGLDAMCMLIFHPVSVTVGYTGSSPPRKCFVTLEIPRHPLRLMYASRGARRAAAAGSTPANWKYSFRGSRLNRLQFLRHRSPEVTPPQRTSQLITGLGLDVFVNGPRWAARIGAACL